MAEIGILEHRIVTVHYVPGTFQFCHTCSNLVLKTTQIYYLTVEFYRSKVQNGSHEAKIMMPAEMYFFGML